MPAAVLLGLGSALCWGTADFFGGLLSRRLPVFTVVFWSQFGGGLIWLLALLASGQPTAGPSIAWGMAAGLFGGCALLLFYRGLALGAMSIVAPVTACGAVVPVIASLVLGEVPSPLAGLGVAAALVGIVLVSRPSGQLPHPSGRPGLVLALALGAAVGFGTFFVLMDQAAARGSPLWAAVGTRIGSAPMLLAISLVGRRPLAWPGRRILPIAAIGLTDLTANALFAYASTQGDLAVVGVLSSLYPVATVLLARLILAERLALPQGLGVTLALAGVVLMAAG